MEYNVDDICGEAKVVLDMNYNDEVLLSDRDETTLTIDELVKSKVEEAARSAVLSAPVHWIVEDTACLKTLGTASAQGNFGSVSLPEDFLRLAVAMASGWEVPVYEAIPPGDERQRMLKRPFAGLRPTTDNPVAAIVAKKDTEGMELELYPYAQGDTLTAGSYVAEPKIDEDGMIELPRRCYRAMVYMAAALAAASLGDKEKTQMLMEIAKGMMEQKA